MKLLIVAYACEPGKGSEQGTGWNLAIRLAKHHEVTVLTRANNEGVISDALAEMDGAKPQFLYHDLSSRMLSLKKKSFFPVQLYYALWLRSVGSFLKEQGGVAQYDLVHHLTFNSFEIPPAFLLDAPGLKFWGPVGGGQVAPEALIRTIQPIAAIQERLRKKRVGLSAAAKTLKQTLGACDAVLFANEETRNLLSPFCGNRVGVMVDVGVDPNHFTPSDVNGDGTRILFAGKFEPRKGTRILLRAFAKAYGQNDSLRLRMVGDGPEWELEKKWVAEQGLGEVIELPGRRSHAEMAQEFAHADCFIFPSLRDTTGAIALEAMASGVPTICLDHQGARLMVDLESGIRVPVTSEEETIQGMAHAIVKLSDDAVMRAEMGRRGRERVEELFCWESKVDRLLEEYRVVQNNLEQRSSSDKAEAKR